MKNTRISLLSIVLAALLPITQILAAPTTGQEQPQQTSNAGVQPNSFDEPSQEEIEAVYKDMLINAYIRIPQAIKSKILALNLMVSNGQIKLSSARDRKAFTAALDSVSQSWKKYCNPADPAEDITKIFDLNQQIVAYLLHIVKQDLKDLTPFTFRPMKQSEISLGDMYNKLEQFARTYHELEMSMNDLGKTKFTKFKRWIGEVNRKGKYGAKAFMVGAGAFVASVLRYAMKPMPPHVIDEYRRFGSGRGADANVAEQPDSGLWHSVSNSDVGNAISNNGFVRWYDDNIIGTPPYTMPMTQSSALDINRPYIHGTGTGLFGTLDKMKIPLIFAVTLPLALKAFGDKIIDGISGWKALHKDPAEFFKLGELFNNEKQQVSMLEQQWIQNALEHSEPRITFDDIAGLAEQKEELMPVIKYLLNPELFEKTGTAIEKGYLLYGPTRTGKTYLAEALAGELVHRYGKPLTFLKVNSSEMKMVGIKKVIDVIKKYAPCIVFIDELDLLNLQRDRSSDMLEQFLTSMKQDEGKQIIFLAATNRLDHLDQALLQPGRFGKIIPFENPSFKDRREFFEKELMRRQVDPRVIDLQRLALETEDCSFGDLASILNHALSKSMQNRSSLSYENFESGIDTFKRMIVESVIQIPVEERAVITTNLAGQAIAYSLLPTGEHLHQVTMMPTRKKVVEERIWYSENTSGPKKIIGYGDLFTLHKLNTAGFDSVEQKMNKIKALMAGFAAEKLMLGATAYSYRTENMEHARQLAEAMVFKGLKKEHFSRDAADAKLNEVQKLLEKCELEVTQLLTENKENIKKIAEALESHGRLSQADVREIITPKAMVVKESQAPTGMIKTSAPAA